jgi:hypothetical protein
MASGDSLGCSVEARGALGAAGAHPSAAGGGAVNAPRRPAAPGQRLAGEVGDMRLPRARPAAGDAGRAGEAFHSPSSCGATERPHPLRRAGGDRGAAPRGAGDGECAAGPAGLRSAGVVGTEDCRLLAM